MFRKIDVVVAAIVFAGANLATCKALRAQNDIARQAQCELSALRDARSVVATQLIRSACNWLALNGDSLLNERSKPYYVCLVQNLSGVQVDEAARATVSACRASYPP